MKAKITICEFARPNNIGTLYDAIGAGITMFIVPKFPSVLIFAVLAEITFEKKDGANYGYELIIFDEDKKPVSGLISGKLAKDKAVPETLFASFNIQLNIKRETKLSVSFKIKNKSECEAPLKIVLDKKRSK